MDKKKKRLAKGLIAAALVGVIAVGSTLAYLSANTGQKTNKFTGANIGGVTKEDFEKEKAENYEPGQLIHKAPTITIDANSADAKVAMSVDYYGDNVKTEEKNGVVTVTNAGEATKMSQENFKRYATVEGWNTGVANGQWTLIATSTNGSELYMYNDVIDTAKEEVATQPLFTNTRVNAGLRTVTETDSKSTTVYDKDGKKVDFSQVSNTIKESYYTDGLGNILVRDSLPTFVIDVNGFAVQSENLEGTSAAAELIKLANNGRTGNDIFEEIV